MSTFVALDHTLFQHINGLQGVPSVDLFFTYASDLGTFLGAIVAITLYLVHKRPTPVHLRNVGIGFGVAAVVSLFNVVIKFAVSRPRPPVAVPGTHVLGPMLSADSFPSGHSVVAFATAAVLLAIDKPLGRFWLGIACLVGFSRCYVGVHFPSDVVVGALLGFFGARALMARVWATVH